MATQQRRASKRRSAATHTVRRAAAAPATPKSLDADNRTVRAVIATDTPVRIYDDLGNGQVGEIDEVLMPSGMAEPASANESAPSSESAPPNTHASTIVHGPHVPRATASGETKIPVPIIAPAVSSVADHRPSSR